MHSQRETADKEIERPLSAFNAAVDKNHDCTSIDTAEQTQYMYNYTDSVQTLYCSSPLRQPTRR